MSGKVIYGHITKPKDISSINRKIRSDVRSAKSKARLTELKRRSRYLITMTHGPSLRKRKNAKALRARARSEYNKTTKAVNHMLKKICKSCEAYKV